LAVVVPLPSDPPPLVSAIAEPTFTLSAIAQVATSSASLPFLTAIFIVTLVP